MLGARFEKDVERSTSFWLHNIWVCGMNGCKTSSFCVSIYRGEKWFRKC